MAAVAIPVLDIGALASESGGSQASLGSGNDDQRLEHEDEDEDAESFVSESELALSEWDDLELSDPESDLEDALPEAEATRVAGRAEYFAACSELNIVPVSAFVKTVGEPRVSLRHYCLGEKAARAVSLSLRCSSIVSLDLADTWLQPAGGVAVAAALAGVASLQYLDVSNNRLGRKGGKAMAELAGSSPNLLDFCLRSNRLDDAVAVALAQALSHNKSITRLDLAQNEIDDAGGMALGAMLLANSSIRDLDLSWNRLKAKAGAGFAKGLEFNATLTCLDLAWNGIRDDGARKLGAALAGNAVLRHCNLGHNCISNEVFVEDGPCPLSEGIASNKGLVSLVLDGNPLGVVGTKKLQKALEGNEAILNVGLKDVEATSAWDSRRGEPKAPRAAVADDSMSAEEAGASLAPRQDGRRSDMLSPRNHWAKTTLQPLNPTGFYTLNLSRPWERSAAMELAKIKTASNVEPLATIAPNLAVGAERDRQTHPFAIKQSLDNPDAVPDTGILKVQFKVTKHPRRRTVYYELDMADAAQVAVADGLRAAAAELVHEEIAESSLEKVPFTIDLESALWKWPAEGTLAVTFLTPDVSYLTRFELDLGAAVPRAIAELMARRALHDTSNHTWDSSTIDGAEWAPAHGTKLPISGTLHILLSQTVLVHDRTEAAEVKLDRDRIDEYSQLRALIAAWKRGPSTSVQDMCLDGAPITAAQEAELLAMIDEEGTLLVEIDPMAEATGSFADGVLTARTVHTSVPHGGKALSEGDALQLKSNLSEAPSEEQRYAKLRRGLQAVALEARQGAALVNSFEDAATRMKATLLVLAHLHDLENALAELQPPPPVDEQ